MNRSSNPLIPLHLFTFSLVNFSFSKFADHFRPVAHTDAMIKMPNGSAAGLGRRQAGSFRANPMLKAGRSPSNVASMRGASVESLRLCRPPEISCGKRQKIIK